MKTALADVRVYDQGQGDAYVTDRGFAWYDVLAPGAGEISTNAGRPALQFIDGFGLVCAATVVACDTRIANYVASGGLWEERRPAYGDRRYRLVQYDASDSVSWSITSRFPLPQDPEVAWTIRLSEVPADWSGPEPYVRIEFAGEWALQFAESGSGIMHLHDASWTQVADLPQLRTDSENLIVLRCLRGIAVSLDYGRTWSWYRAAGAIRSMPWSVRGCGHVIAVGLHQLQMAAGTYTSEPRNTYTRRLSTDATITGRASVPPGASITYADASQPDLAIARYTATLTPAVTAGVPFQFYHSAALYAVQFTYPVTRSSPTRTYTTPFANLLTRVSIRRAFQPDETSATIEIQRDAAQAWVANLRRSKVAIRLGWSEDGVEEWYTRFTGYVSRVTARRDDVGRAVFAIELENTLARFRHTEWSVTDEFALGGMTVNQALDWVLASEGLDASGSMWHSAGDRVVLPPGEPETPVELLRRGERKLETLQRLASYAGLEVVARDDGVIATSPRCYVSPVVTCDLYASAGGAGGELDDWVIAAEADVSYDDSATAVVVVAKSADGEAGEAVAWCVDTTAETDITSDRFSPWREIVHDELPATSDHGLLVARAQSLASDLFAIRHDVTVASYANLSLNRRDRVRIYGCDGIGVPDGAEYVVLTLDDDWRVSSDGDITLRTVAGCRRI